MAKKEQNQHLQILSDIRKRNFKPVYFLMGDEAYYIDLITDAIIETALEDSERDFNQTVVYGADVTIASVINAAKRYPMMAQRQLVVVREAQQIKNMEELSYYLQQPLMSTVLVINYKNGPYKQKKVLTEAEKVGVVFESKKIYDSQLPSFISNYVAEKGLGIEQKAVVMLADAIGTDLGRLTGELEKLTITIPQGVTRITAAQVEANVGISKDFNNFELLNALITRDVYKANLIQRYFESNPKANPLIVTIGVLFNFFSNLMLLYFSPDRSEAGVMNELKLRNIYQSRDYLAALKAYDAFQCIDIIDQLRKCDARSKGIGNSSIPDGELLKELLFRILHSKSAKYTG